MDDVEFWSNVNDGLGLMLNIDSLVTEGNYSQIVYYNSTINNLQSSRQIMLVNFNQEGNAELTWANPTITNG